MSTPPEPGERVEVAYDDGAVCELPPWPTAEQVAERDAWIAEQCARFGLT